MIGGVRNQICRALPTEGGVSSWGQSAIDIDKLLLHCFRGELVTETVRECDFRPRSPRNVYLMSLRADKLCRASL
jgi:hypothetical protein